MAKMLVAKCKIMQKKCRKIHKMHEKINFVWTVEAGLLECRTRACPDYSKVIQYSKPDNYVVGTLVINIKRQYQYNINIRFINLLKNIAKCKHVYNIPTMDIWIIWSLNYIYHLEDLFYSLIKLCIIFYLDF